MTFTTGASPSNGGTATAGTAYVYRVSPSAARRPPNRWDGTLATTVIFTDPMIVAKITRIRCEHIEQLRLAVNAVQRCAGLPQSSFTDPNLQGKMISTIQITELRTALDQARAVPGLSPMVFTDKPLAANISCRQVGCAQNPRMMTTLHRIRSVGVFVLLTLVGQLGMSSVGWSFGRLSLFGQHLALAALTILWLAVSGFCAGRLAARSDIAFVVLEAVTLAMVLLSVLMAAVETGAGDAMRNVLIGIAGMATVAVAYWMAQRSARAEAAAAVVRDKPCELCGKSTYG